MTADASRACSRRRLPFRLCSWPAGRPAGPTSFVNEHSIQKTATTNLRGKLAAACRRSLSMRAANCDRSTGSCEAARIRVRVLGRRPHQNWSSSMSPGRIGPTPMVAAAANGDQQQRTRDGAEKVSVPREEAVVRVRAPVPIKQTAARQLDRERLQLKTKAAPPLKNRPQ
jgi:hypothetical protein